jgi:hypothetical protein
MNEARYWIGVVAADDVAAAVAGGYAQLNHGKAGALERMRGGDALAFCSPRTADRDGAAVQAFTALGRIRPNEVYQADAAGGPRPFRVAVDYLPATPAPIRPLLDDLSFIRNKARWGVAFRYGVVRVPETDFLRIAAATGCPLPATAARGG